jgi:hypothetical protein
LRVGVRLRWSDGGLAWARKTNNNNNNNNNNKNK